MTRKGYFWTTSVLISAASNAAFIHYLSSCYQSTSSCGDVSKEIAVNNSHPPKLSCYSIFILLLMNMVLIRTKASQWLHQKYKKTLHILHYFRCTIHWKLLQLLDLSDAAFLFFFFNLIQKYLSFHATKVPAQIVIEICWFTIRTNAEAFHPFSLMENFLNSTNVSSNFKHLKCQLFIRKILRACRALSLKSVCLHLQYTLDFGKILVNAGTNKTL